MKRYTYQMEWIIEVIAESEEEALEMLPPLWSNDTQNVIDETIDLISEAEVEACS